VVNPPNPAATRQIRPGKYVVPGFCRTAGPEQINLSDPPMAGWIRNTGAKFMPKYTIRFIAITAAAVLSALTTLRADTWRLGGEQDWKSLSTDQKDKYLLAVAETKKLVNAGQTAAARKAFNKLKKDFPEIAGPDLDVFIEAEILFCRGKFTKAVSTYDKLLTDYPESQLREAALDRQFAIGTAFLGGEKIHVLWLFRVKGYDEGVKIVEKITERAGIDSPIGIKAALAVAKSYEKREMFDEAYLKWWEISLQWETGEIGRDALLGMARCKHAAYNKYPERKRPRYDVSGLKTAKTCYEKFRLIYPQDAEKIGVTQILKQIHEQLAYKQLSIGQYYQRTGSKQSANLYYQMLTGDNNWQGTQAAEIAKQLLTQKPGSNKAKK
jgi:outer membrane protein assembly factor BamD (BamD/ComL family)